MGCLFPLVRHITSSSFIVQVLLIFSFVFHVLLVPHWSTLVRLLRALSINVRWRAPFTATRKFWFFKKIHSPHDLQWEKDFPPTTLHGVFSFFCDVLWTSGCSVNLCSPMLRKWDLKPLLPGRKIMFRYTWDENLHPHCADRGLYDTVKCILEIQRLRTVSHPRHEAVLWTGYIKMNNAQHFLSSVLQREGKGWVCPQHSENHKISRWERILELSTSLSI